MPAPFLVDQRRGLRHEWRCCVDSSLVAQLRRNPGAIVSAINDALAQVAFLRAEYEGLTGVALPDVPESIAAPLADAGPTFGPNGLSAPRADGAVRSQAWDSAIDAALMSSDPVAVRWGMANSGRRWVLCRTPWHCRA